MKILGCGHRSYAPYALLDLRKSLSKTAKSFEPWRLSAKANASAAGDAALETYRVFRQAQTGLRGVREATRALARRRLMEDTQAVAEAEAESYVGRREQGEAYGLQVEGSVLGVGVARW